MMVVRSSPFGGKTRTAVLLALRLLSESYARELARTLGSSLSGIQKALQGLERDGLVAGRAMGRTRLYRINPRYFDPATNPPKEQEEEFLYYQPCSYCERPSNDPLCRCATAAASHGDSTSDRSSA